MNGYAFGDVVKNCICLIYTKIVWKDARLIRLPFLARNRKNISIGKGFTCGVNCRINPGIDAQITIGKNFVMGDQCQIEAQSSIVIGDSVLFASRVFVGDSAHGRYEGDQQSSPYIPPNDREIVASSISIGDNVWVGNGVSILAGVSIGSGVIIGANSVVTHDVPNNCMVVGNPARIIKKYDGDLWKSV